jgi:hypothetical protein
MGPNFLQFCWLTLLFDLLEVVSTYYYIFNRMVDWKIIVLQTVVPVSISSQQLIN